MPDSPENLGRQLAALEAVNPTARERYERQLQGMLKDELSIPARGCCLALGAASLLLGAGSGFTVSLDEEAHAYWPNLALGAVMTVAALAVGTALVGAAVAGTYRREHEGRWIASSGVVLLATWGLFMLLAGHGLPGALRDVFLTLGLLCLGVAAFVAQRLSAARAQLVLRKRLLELEYSVAEIAQRLDREGRDE